MSRLSNRQMTLKRRVHLEVSIRCHFPTLVPKIELRTHTTALGWILDTLLMWELHETRRDKGLPGCHEL